VVGDPARSLTIVRLDTGEVIRSFRREVDGPTSILGRSHNALNAYTPLVGAISGQPVVFPSQAGAVADRAFVGDKEGLMWRVDFSSTNPQDWKMDLFFDAFTGKDWNEGQPIATPPILSVDGLGNLTVAFSTGDQEQFVATPSITNYLWSVSEDASATPAFKSKANYNRTFTDGTRVSGPMQLFNSNLYYTTYTPPPLNPTAADQCSDGSSQLCAQHYLRPAATPNDGGEPAVPALPGALAFGCVPEGTVVIFGPGITQEPTCFQTDSYNDPYLGTGGQHTSLSGVTAGKFNLVVQTGRNGKNETGGQINTTTVGLEAPLAGTRIDSWAAVVE
jgi:type IV pilus assembly protein PilY1